MKLLNLRFEDDEFFNLKAAKGDLTWKNFFLKTIEIPINEEQLLEAIERLEARTDLSQDNKEMRLKPLLEKKRQMDILKAQEERDRQEREEQARLRAIEAEEQRKITFEKNKSIFIDCAYCSKKIDLNNICILKGKQYCLSCKNNKEIWGVIIDEVYYGKSNISMPKL